jgi:hypothetical protein
MFSDARSIFWGRGGGFSLPKKEPVGKGWVYKPLINGSQENQWTYIDLDLSFQENKEPTSVGWVFYLVKDPCFWIL